MIRRTWVGPIASPLLVLLLVLVVAGCRTTPAALVTTHGVPLAIDDPRADRMLESYLATLDARRALRGLARVSLSGPDFKLNRPQRVVVERPAHLRFEILGLFDQLAAILTTDEDQFGFFDAATGEITRGRVSPSLLWDLAKIDLTADEAVGLLLGTPAPAPGLARSAVWLEPDGTIALAFAWPLEDPPADCETNPASGLFDRDCFVSEAALAAGGEVFFFDALGRLVELRSLESAGAVRYRTTFEEYRMLGGSDEGRMDGVIFPMRITIDSPGVASEARFDWKRVMLESDLPDRLFTLPEPHGPELER